MIEGLSMRTYKLRLAALLALALSLVVVASAGATHFLMGDRDDRTRVAFRVEDRTITKLSLKAHYRCGLGTRRAGEVVIRLGHRDTEPVAIELDSTGRFHYSHIQSKHVTKVRLRGRLSGGVMHGRFLVQMREIEGRWQCWTGRSARNSWVKFVAPRG